MKKFQSLNHKKVSIGKLIFLIDIMNMLFIVSIFNLSMVSFDDAIIIFYIIFLFKGVLIMQIFERYGKYIKVGELIFSHLFRLVRIAVILTLICLPDMPIYLYIIGFLIYCDLCLQEVKALNEFLKERINKKLQRLEAERKKREFEEADTVKIPIVRE